MRSTSPHPRDSAVPSSNFEWTCTSCGNVYISKSYKCAVCNGTGKKGEEITKKVIDPPDLIK